MEYTDSIENQPSGSFTNEAVPTVPEDGFGYTRLRRKLSGYEKLRHPALMTDDESANTSLQSLSMDISEYNDLNQSENGVTYNKSDKVGPQSQYDGYVGTLDYPETLETFNNIGDSKETQEEPQQNQYAGYVDDKAKILENKEESVFTRPQIQIYGYEPFTEYHDIVAKQAVSMETEQESGNSRPQSQSSGYTPITEYHDIITKQAVSMETEDESGMLVHRARCVDMYPLLITLTAFYNFVREFLIKQYP